MLKFFRKKNRDTPPSDTSEAVVEPTVETPPPSSEEATSSTSSWFSRLKHSLKRTRNQLSENLASLFLGKKEIDDTLLEEIETRLLSADIGVEATQYVLQTLTQGISRKELKDPAAVYQALKTTLQNMITPCEQSLQLTLPASPPFVILVIGVNGAGKTTTIGKLAKKIKSAGHSVMLAAGDTFRAAAIEQLQVWGQRNAIPVIAQKAGADSASVIFDALQSAKTKGIDVLIADTAGRLHTKDNLMEELKKIKRVLQKIDPLAPHETMLVLDASMGQNALVQAEKFHDALNVTGITLTKLDGTAKGGTLFAIAHKLKVPIQFIGIGEKVEDLQPFDAAEFVNALFDDQPQNH